MKKASTSALSEPPEDDLLPEYRFDYTRAKRNRFADQGNKRGLSVLLDDDVAEFFTTPESVNKALRALIEAVPVRPRAGARSRGSRRRPPVDSPS
jgi:hypothetical protein